MTPAMIIADWEWRPAAPPWISIPAIVLAVACAIFFYRAHATIAARATVGTLATLRVALLLCVLSLLLAPTHVSTRVRHTRGTLRVVVDDSGSMRHVDAQRTADEIARWASSLKVSHEQVRAMSRADLARASLDALEPITRQFDAHMISLSALAGSQKHSVTDLGDALLKSTEGGDATVLLVSDGRHNAGAAPEDAARRLAARGARVFTLNVGSPQPVRDAAVEFVDAPDSVFLGDEVALRADVRLDGFAPAETVTIALMRDGKTIDTRSLPAAETHQLEFTDPSPPKGEHAYEIAIAPTEGEAEMANNRRAARVAVKDEKINVLLVDDEPRWEYRFLRNELARDHRVALRSLLLSPARIENVVAPPEPPPPMTREAWSGFDVVILGDVPPERLGPAQQSLLADCLKAGRPKALMLLAGPRNMPARYAGSPLAELAPVELSSSAWSRQQFDAHLRRGFQPVVAPGAMVSVLARIAGDEQASRGAWDAAPPWYWHASQTVARPGASAIWAIAEPAAVQAPDVSDSDSFRHRALLATMRYGAGRVLYLAGAETWRLRYVPHGTAGGSADVHSRFWGHALRWAVAGDPAPDEASAALNDFEHLNLSADPRRMAAIAKAGGGLSFDGPDFAKLADALPNVDHAQTTASRIGLFDDANPGVTRAVHWAFLLVFVALLTAEWVVRKRGGMV